MVVGAAIVFNANFRSQNKDLTDISLANVEALANGEPTADDCDRLCKYDDTHYCLIGNSAGTKICHYTFPRNL